jgi:hypothetical protein
MSKCDIHQEKIEHLKEEMAEMKDSFGEVVGDLKSATKLIMDAKNDISEVGNKTFNKLLLVLGFLGSVSFALIHGAMENSKDALVAITKQQGVVDNLYYKFTTLEDRVKLLEGHKNEPKGHRRSTTKPEQNRKAKKDKKDNSKRVSDNIIPDFYDKRYKFRLEKMS